MNRSGDAYDEFADFYATGNYVRYSEQLADQFGDVAEFFDASGERVLDVMCGEGSFVTSIAEDGFDATGIDVSERMICLAREQATESGADPDFHVMDAREFDLPGRFDVATCWFDSVNHLLDRSEVAATFERVHDSLRDGGTFIFDVNTIRRLVEYEFDGTRVVRNDEDRFEAYADIEFDYGTNLLTLTITGFERNDGQWERFDEIHRERGYELDEIEHTLRNVGFEEVERVETLDPIESPDEEGRAYFAATKGD